MSDTVIGLDIGSGSIKAAQVRRENGTFIVEHQAAAALPHGSVQDGRVMPESIEAVTAIIRDTVTNEPAFTTDEVVFGLNSSGSVFMRELVVPAAITRKDDLDKAMPNIIQAQLKITDADNEISYTVLGETVEAGQPKLRVMVYWVRSDFARQSAEIVEAAGLKVVGADLNALASLRAVSLVQTAPDKLGAVVDVGSDVMSVMLHQNGVPISLYFDPDMTGAALTTRIGDLADLDVEDGEAEWAKINDADAGGVVDMARVNFSRLLAAKIQGVADAHIARSNGQITGLGHVLLVGGGSLLQGLGRTVREEIPGTLVDFATFDDTISGSTGPVARYPQAFGADYLVAVGLGTGDVL